MAASSNCAIAPLWADTTAAPNATRTRMTNAERGGEEGVHVAGGDGDPDTSTPNEACEWNDVRGGGDRIVATDSASVSGARAAASDERRVAKSDAAFASFTPPTPSSHSSL